MMGSMNYERVLLAAAGGFVAYFAFGFLVFGALPLLREEYAKYPDVYRNQDGIKKVMPIGMAAMFVAILVLVWLYAMSCQPGYGPLEGARFGGAVLKMADFRGANLAGARELTSDQLTGSITDGTTVLPNGKRGPYVRNSGAERVK